MTDNTARAEWLQPAESALWDEFVRAHPCGLVYHLSAWREVIERSFAHIQGRFLVLRNSAGGEITAGLPVYIVRSWLLGNRAVSVPFASICDPLISSARDLNALLPSIAANLRTSGCKRLEIRCMLNGALVAETGLGRQISNRHHYLPLDRSLDELLRSFSESCVRRKIEKAKKEGIVVSVRTSEVDSESDLAAFYDLLTETRRRLSLPPIPLCFLKSIWRVLPTANRTLFLGLKGGQPIGCLLTLSFRRVWGVEYSGDSASARSSGVNQLLYWEAIKLAHSQGAQRFSLGRTAIRNEGLLVYKRRWATIEADLPHFYFPHSVIAGSPGRSGAREESLPYRLMRAVLGKAPEPVYRVLGAFCYRHLG